MQKKLKYLLIIILAILQLSFFRGLGAPWFNMDLFLSVAVFWTIYFGIEESMPSIIIGAFILDLFSGHIFGMTAVSVFLVCYFIHLLYFHFLTNQSFFSLLILGIIAVLGYNFLFFCFYYFFYWLNINEFYIFIDTQYWNNLIWQIVFVLLLLVIFYRFFGFSKKLQD
jgi:rod shape-determining protein MreD